MIDNVKITPSLVEPERDFVDVEEFPATLDARGTYSTEKFVLRLSPKIHRELNSIKSNGIVNLEDLTPQLLQAFSTYLHETVHWWQHKGPTSGLVLSLQYPSVTYQNHDGIKKVLAEIGPVKSLRGWAEDQAKSGRDDTELSLVNSCVNNAMDAEFYASLTLNPPAIKQVVENVYFESLGHAYWIAYAQSVSLMASVCDPKFERLPDTADWENRFASVRAAGQDGFGRGGQVHVAPIGVRALFEGQARFAQLQYLVFPLEKPLTIAQLRDAGMLSGIYGEAFNVFLKTTNANPDNIDDPAVALFMLIVDIAINPTRGIPIAIENFEDFIIDVDPGIRFIRLCGVAREKPELLQAIKYYTRQEYIEVAETLTAGSGYDHPLEALSRIAAWKDTPELSQIM